MRLVIAVFVTCLSILILLPELVSSQDCDFTNPPPPQLPKCRRVECGGLCIVNSAGNGCDCELMFGDLMMRHPQSRELIAVATSDARLAASRATEIGQLFSSMVGTPPSDAFASDATAWGSSLVAQAPRNGNSVR
jgi:hypothetical protein